MIKNNKFFKVTVCALILIFCGFYFYKNYFTNNHKIKINDVEFFVEVVDDDLERARGLGGRDGLCEGCGMLFVFDEVGQYGFWMKDMKFDIDILWIKNGEIVYIEKGVSHETPKVVYNPDVGSDMVLEVDSGAIEEFGIEVGDKIEF